MRFELAGAAIRECTIEAVGGPYEIARRRGMWLRVRIEFDAAGAVPTLEIRVPVETDDAKTWRDIEDEAFRLARDMLSHEGLQAALRAGPPGPSRQ